MTSAGTMYLMYLMSQLTTPLISYDIIKTHEQLFNLELDKKKWLISIIKRKHKFYFNL